jgi:hypothetical protein
LSEAACRPSSLIPFRQAYLPSAKTRNILATRRQNANRTISVIVPEYLSNYFSSARHRKHHTECRFYKAQIPSHQALHTTSSVQKLHAPVKRNRNNTSQFHATASRKLNFNPNAILPLQSATPITERSLLASRLQLPLQRQTEPVPTLSTNATLLKITNLSGCVKTRPTLNRCATETIKPNPPNCNRLSKNLKARTLPKQTTTTNNWNRTKQHTSTHATTNPNYHIYYHSLILLRKRNRKKR